MPGREVVGVDVGGTKVSAAVMRAGSLSEPVLAATETGSAELLVSQIAAIAESLRSEQTAAIGVGVPSIVDFEAGRVKTSVNVPLRDLPLRDLLVDRLGLPVFVDNDATCAALAEACEGEVPVVRHLVMLTVGTGVGGGVIIDGRPYRGATGAAGEIGHTLIGLDLERGAAAIDRFPQPGSLESLAAGRALDALAAEAGYADGSDAVAAAQRGEQAALELLRLIGERLGIGIANAINLLDPDEVVIGGGVASAGELLLEPARDTARKFVLPGIGDATEIRLARHGTRAGVLGAALLAAIELASAPAATDAARA